MTDADEDTKSDDLADDVDKDVDKEAADKGSDTGSDTGSGKTRNRLSSRTKIRLLGIAGVVVLAVGVALVAVRLGQNSVPAGGAQPTVSDSTASFRHFRDEKAGFSLSYPSDWQRLQAADPQVTLLAVHGEQDSFQARVITLDFAVGKQELASVKPLTDRLVAANKSAELLAEPKQVELNGVPGYFYFYTFKDPQTGQTGAHSHFFLFNGRKMITLVFQAVPTEAFPPIASTFDKITQSFQLLKK